MCEYKAAEEARRAAAFAREHAHVLLRDLAVATRELQEAAAAAAAGDEACALRRGMRVAERQRDLVAAQA